MYCSDFSVALTLRMCVCCVSVCPWRRPQSDAGIRVRFRCTIDSRGHITQLNDTRNVQSRIKHCDTKSACIHVNRVILLTADARQSDDNIFYLKQTTCSTNGFPLIFVLTQSACDSVIMLVVCFWENSLSRHCSTGTDKASAAIALGSSPLRATLHASLISRSSGVLSYWSRCLVPHSSRARPRFVCCRNRTDR